MKGIRRFIGDRAFYKMVLAVMLPIMLQNGITNFVGLLDNIMIGQVGTDQMSGVSIANQLLLIFNLAAIGGSSAAGLFGAQFYGKRDHVGVQNVLRIKLWFSVIISVLGALIFTVFGRQLLSLFLHEGGSTGNAEATLQYGLTYLNLSRFLLLPFSVVQAYSSTLRETAKTVPPMRAGLIAVFVNLFFNWVLIFGKLGMPALGVSGAILATIISRIVELVLVVNRSPMLVRICLLAVLPKRVLLGGGVAVLAIGVYDYLVCGVRICRSSFCHSQSIYGYKCT